MAHFCVSVSTDLLEMVLIAQTWTNAVQEHTNALATIIVLTKREHTVVTAGLDYSGSQTECGVKMLTSAAQKQIVAQT